MKIKVVTQQLSQSTSKAIFPEEFHLQEELNNELKRTLSVFFEANSERGMQIMGTALSCLTVATVSLAKTLEMSEAEALDLFKQIIKSAGFKNDLH
jgi:hypothetical protein